MLIKKLLAVLWLCVLRSNVNGSVDVTTAANWSTEGGHPFPQQDIAFGKAEPIDSYAASSTVRSFFPVRGKQKWMRRIYPPVEEMLFFNVSAVKENEEVSLAELHLHRRRIGKIHGTFHKHFLPLPYRVILYQVQPMYKRKFDRDAKTMKLASIPVSHTTKNGWHTLDITAVLRELLNNAQGPIQLLLGVHFESPRGIAKSSNPLVPLKQFLKATGGFDSDHRYRASSYLVVFSEIDPYFDEMEQDEEEEEYYWDEKENEIPNGHVFRERHLKHKIFRVNADDKNEGKKMKMDKMKKHKTTMENEVYKTDYGRRKEEDVVRHKSKHGIADVKRSKADELALQEKNKLKSLPFLHTNEVEEMRQTSRRLTRSLPGPEHIKTIIINHIKELEKSAATNQSREESCMKREVQVTLNGLNLNLKPTKLLTVQCSGPCSSGNVISTGRCKPAARKAVDLAYYDSKGRTVSIRLDDLVATECECR